MNDEEASQEQAEDDFPWEDVESARGDLRLQGQHPVEDGNARYQAEARACPGCGAPPSELSWFYFESPEETWAQLCGVAGWLTVCDRCHRQVNCFKEIVS